VSGEVIDVLAGINEILEEDQPIVEIDPRDTELALKRARAELESATQNVEAGGEKVISAQARVAEARADLVYDQRQTARILSLYKSGIKSNADADRARARLAQAEARVAAAKAELESARQQLGIEGEDNPHIRAAASALSAARLDLARTTVRAPSRGVITNLRVEVGHVAAAGQPIATFISARDVWIEAYMRENSLGRIDPGDPVDLVLDVAPGRVFAGEVVSVGAGIRFGPGESPGQLPSIEPTSGWLRNAQRFPVIIRFADDEAMGLRREGGQADVMVYTGRVWPLNALGWLWIRLVSLLSYAY
jgi:multidrug resistance efflux pump